MQMDIFTYRHGVFPSLQGAGLPVFPWPYLLAQFTLMTE